MLACWTAYKRSDTYVCFCMVIPMVTALREDQRRNGLTTFMKTALTWTFHYIRLPVLLRTGRPGGTLFSIWAANAQCHRHRRNGSKSSKSSVLTVLLTDILITPPPVGGRGIDFERFLYFFIYLFICQQHYEKTAGQICMKFSGKVWSDNGTTWFNFGSIRLNGSAGRRSSCLLSPAIAQSQLHSLEGGLLCRAPQLVVTFSLLRSFGRGVGEKYKYCPCLECATVPLYFFGLSFLITRMTTTMTRYALLVECWVKDMFTRKMEKMYTFKRIYPERVHLSSPVHNLAKL